MKNLKKIRKSKGMKQLEIAKYLNVTEATYSRYESGITNVTPDTLIKLSEFFDVTTDYLLGVIDIPMSPSEMEIIAKIDEGLEDQELLKEFDLTLDGKKVTKAEAELLIKAIRFMNEQK